MNEVLFFNYGQKEIEHLSHKDSVLAKAIAFIGKIERPVTPDLFSSLIKSIVGQQISTKAQVTIWARMQEKLVPFNANSLSALSTEEVQAFGMSMRKASYIKAVVDAVQSAQLDLEALYALSDEEVCTKLRELKGVGLWTAEMMLLFSMQRPDVLSFGDLAIQRGLRMLYGHQKISSELYKKYKRRYSPYGSTASLYLWAIAGGAMPELKDPMAKKLPNKKR